MSKLSIKSCITRFVNRMITVEGENNLYPGYSRNGKIFENITINDNKCTVYWSSLDFSSYFGRTALMESWWMEEPYNGCKDKELRNIYPVGLMTSANHNDRFYPIFISDMDLDNYEFAGLDFRYIIKLLGCSFNSEVNRDDYGTYSRGGIEQNLWIVPSSDGEYKEFMTICKNQDKILSLFQEYDNMSALHVFKRKELKTKIINILEYNYLSLGKIFMDKSGLSFDEEIESICAWINDEKINHFSKKRDFRYVESSARSYGQVVSHNKAALSAAKKRKKEIESCYEEICKKKNSLRWAIV